MKKGLSVFENPRSWRTRFMRSAEADHNAVGEHVVIVSLHSPEGREVEARLRVRASGSRPASRAIG
jgi:hypothetical protein